MNISMNGKVDGYYSVKVIRNAGKNNERVEDFGEHKNLLLDGFFTRWLGGSIAGSSWRFFVGTGATPPVNSNTQLESQIGAASDAAIVTPNNNVLEGSDYIASSTGVAQWAVGAIVGNISEIGANIRNITTSTSLDSRALIVPSSISVTASDQLVVSYTIRYRIPVAQHVSVVDFGEGNTTCTLETLGVLDNLQWGINTVFDTTYPFRPSPSMRISSSAGLQNNVALNANFGTASTVGISGSSTGSARRVTLTASTTQFNEVGNIKYILIMSPAALARQGILFDPPIAKTNTKSLVLNFDYTLVRA